MMKDYSELTSRIYTQLSPELSQEFHNMLTDMAKEISRLYEIENAKPSEALECLEELRSNLGVIYNNTLDNIEQALLKTQEQEKVLEIIKNKTVDIELLKNSHNVEEYNNELSLLKISKYLTEEEFNLLKRWLV